MVPSARTRKKKKKEAMTRPTRMSSYSYKIRARTAVKKNDYLDIVRDKSNPTLWNHIFKLQRQCRGA